MSLLLVVKLALSPTLIGAASMAGKRWGPNVAGMLGGMPIVAGPLVVALWLMQGAPYATGVALASPVGVWGNIAYMLALGYASAHCRWPLALFVGWVSYIATVLAIYFAGLATSLWLAILVVPALWLAATRWLPRPYAAEPPASLPRSELLLRIVATAVLVSTLSTISTWLGPSLTGVIAGVPVAATIIPAFTFANAGRDALLLALRGFLTGLMGFTVFFLVLGHTIPSLGVWAMLVALAAGIVTGLLATRLAQRP